MQGWRLDFLGLTAKSKFTNAEWAIPEKNTNRRLEEMEFIGVLKKKFQWSIKKKVEFPGVLKKSSCGIS